VQRRFTINYQFKFSESIKVFYVTATREIKVHFVIEPAHEY